MPDGGFGNIASTVVFRLEDRDAMAAQIIKKYQKIYGSANVVSGIIGTLIPLASMPALLCSIGMSVPLVYQPMAKELAEAYLADPRDIGCVNSRIITQGYAVTSAVEIPGHFGVEYIVNIAQDMLSDILTGVFASCVPLVGSIIAGVLDYKIAIWLTNIVGKMVAIYLQNGQRWVGSKDETYRMAKYAKGDFGPVRNEFRVVRESLLTTVMNMIEMMQRYMNKHQIREALRGKGVPDDLIDEALNLAI